MVAIYHRSLLPRYGRLLSTTEGALTRASVSRISELNSALKWWWSTESQHLLMHLFITSSESELREFGNCVPFLFISFRSRRGSWHSYRTEFQIAPRIAEASVHGPFARPISSATERFANVWASAATWYPAADSQQCFPLTTCADCICVLRAECCVHSRSTCVRRSGLCPALKKTLASRAVPHSGEKE